MKEIAFIIVCLTLTQSSLCRSQGSQPPFVFTLYAGLFFPSQTHFEQIYGSRSDAIWGFGAALPIEPLLFLTGDLAYFRSEGYFDRTIDSAAKLEQRFYHVGILTNQTISRLLYIRLSGGFSYVTIKQTTSSPLITEQSVEADRKIGYFGGIGIERLLQEERLSFFADVLYDYRRSHSKELFGDFGGVRIIMGVHIFMF